MEGGGGEEVGGGGGFGGCMEVLPWSGAREREETPWSEEEVKRSRSYG